MKQELRAGTLVCTGRIESRDPDEMRETLAKLAGFHDWKIDAIQMTSEGGNIKAAFDCRKVLIENEVFQANALQHVNSAAIIPFLAPHYRVSDPKATFLFHWPEFVEGTPVSTEKKTETAIIKWISERTGMNAGEVYGLLHAGESIHADRAQRLGIIHDIVELEHHEVSQRFSTA